MSEQLEKEFEFYLENQSELVEKYGGKVIVIRNYEVIGVFDSELEAVDQTEKKHELGTFLVQRCVPGTENYSYSFHSRVVFA